ncbi:sensor domain-containing diguanylate cyclase [Eubacterium sp.]|uniref:sensor domain-containing diguanylate cyclase n=1 Tax=Eubacterium sp. TaxID=142586 RepID=UPI002FCB6DFA
MKNNQIIQETINNMPEGVAILIFGYKVALKMINEVAVAYSGYDWKTFNTRFQDEILLLVHPDDRDRLVKAVMASFSRNRILKGDFRIVRWDGSIGRLHVRARMIEKNKEHRLVYCTFSDITKDFKLERELAKKQHFIRQQYVFLDHLYQSVPCGIVQCSCDNHPRILNMNKAAYKILGYGKKGFSWDSNRRDWMRSVASEDQNQLAGQIEVVLKEKRETTFECRLLKQDGALIWVSGSMNVLSKPGGGWVMQLVFLDATWAKQQENRLRAEAEQLMKKTERECLTGLLNRRAFEEKVNGALAENEWRHGAFYVLDIDDFKAINDYLGHAKGDLALKYVADVLRDYFDAEDYIARLGGDEFVIFAPKIETEYLALLSGTQICDAMEEWEENGDGISLSVSIGMAITPQHGMRFDLLYHHADLALYDAKKKGKNMCQLYYPDFMTEMKRD